MRHRQLDQPGDLGDIAGLLVGHYQRRSGGWATGTTVVFAPRGVVAAVDVRGGGPGTRETDALDPRNLVDRINAICLSGGSAYGLATADGVMAELERRQLGVRVGPEPHHVVPVVPTAVIFDLARGGRFDRRPTPEFGGHAVTRARQHEVRRGSLGAGTGARAGGLQGGVGMASTQVAVVGADRESDSTAWVAALAVVNSSGSVFDPATGLPWWGDRRLTRPNSADRRALVEVMAAREHHLAPLNTTIGVVATDLDLARYEVGRLAQSAHDGLARAIRPAHALVDGDTVFGVSTCAEPVDRSVEASSRVAGIRTITLDRIFSAAADVFATACTDAVVSAQRVGEAIAYRDVCPSAFRNLRS